MDKKISTPLTKEIISTLSAGDRVLLSGYVYTARDAAHERLYGLALNGEAMPFNFNGAVVYYTGPSPEIPGHAVGSCGPTSSHRMDKYTPALLDLGLSGMIGKGKRSDSVTGSIIKNCSVYFGAIGGLGALLSECVKSSEIICYEDLGTEAIRKLYVEDLPLTVLTDCHGNDLYKIGRENYLKSLNA